MINNNFTPEESASELTKREYFAGLAMQGMCTNTVDVINDDSKVKEIAQMSVYLADALLEKLDK